MSLLAALLRPKNLPPPDPRCRTYDFAQRVELIRNHEAQFRMSRELHSDFNWPQSAANPIGGVK